jgi:hypothetical protein
MYTINVIHFYVDGIFVNNAVRCITNDIVPIVNTSQAGADDVQKKTGMTE